MLHNVAIKGLLAFILTSGAINAAVIPRQASVPPSVCQPLDGTNGTGPYQIDTTCVDPLYGNPVVLNETDQTFPVPHRLIAGIFDNTTVTFNIYLPQVGSGFENRFFQYIYPLANGSATDAEIQFAADQKGYQLAVKGALGYRQDAAAAKFARTVAAKYYGLTDPWKINGYAYGGSGGSLQIVGAVENVQGVWQGIVPYIQAIPTSIPNTVASLAHCALVLGDKGSAIADSVLPGGDGNPERTLNDLERATYRECTKLGLPPRQWEVIKWGYDGGLLLNFYPNIYNIDASYATDFWGETGYVGTEDSDLGRFYRSRRRSGNSTFSNVQYDPAGTPLSLSIDNLPAGFSLFGADFTIVSPNGTVITRLNTLGINEVTREFNLSITPSINSSLFTVPGSLFSWDNSKYLAAHLYHRYQLPVREGFTIYDQYRQGGVSSGAPLYPQRSPLIAPIFVAGSSGGGTHTGAIRSKMIVVQNLLDINSPPWNAYWYKGQVKRALGETKARSMYRLWYTDNADHPEGPVKQSSQNRLIQYDGIIYHALYHISRWHEQGIEPPETTFTQNDGQITAPPTADERGGVQPVVALTVGKGNSNNKVVNVKCGDNVDLAGKVQVPRGLGGIIKAEWDYEGTGTFEPVKIDKAKKTLNLKSQHSYAKAGTYFATLRASSVYDGNINNNFSNAYNLDRARIVVSC
jgi:hypothetical protein